MDCKETFASIWEKNRQTWNSFLKMSVKRSELVITSSNKIMQEKTSFGKKLVYRSFLWDGTFPGTEKILLK